MTIAELHTLTIPSHSRHTDPEHALQVACVRWFRLQYPYALIYAVPNGGQRNVVVASKLKAEGATAGVPDLHIPIPRKGYASLYIEMKNGKAGRLSESQREMIDRLQGYGNKVAVCRTFEEFQSQVNAYML